MKKLVLWFTALTLVLGGIALAVPQSADDPLDSLKVCKETQRLIFENQFVRVIDDNIPAGVTEPMHRHRHGVVVYLNDYAAETRNQGAAPVRQQRKANTALWSDAVVHEVKNVGTNASHAIRIELKF